MTPTPPSGSNPLIYRIADALGVFHLVAPVIHTHTISEITDLDSYIPDQIAGGASGHEAYFAILSNGAIAGSTNTGFGIALRVNGQTKIFEVTADTIENLLRAQSNPDSTPTADSDKLVTSGGVKAALDEKNQIRQDDTETSDHAIVSATASEGDVYILLSVREGNNIKSVHITPDNMENLIRALLNPDTAPTANSTNLVTSGGVKAALVAKANKDDVDFKVFEKNAVSDKINLSTNFAQGQKRATYLIFNYTSDVCALSDLFTYQSGEIETAIVLPTTEQPAIQVDGAVVVSVLKYSDDYSINYIIVPESYY